MKLGFVSAILEQSSFEEMIDTACELGYSNVEVACWPSGKSERRYAGVSHIDVDALDENQVAYIKKYCADRNVEISALAYYPNTLDSNLEKRQAAVNHLEKVILAAEKLGINMVTTFIGRDQFKTIEENLKLVGEIWPSILTLAEEHHVKVAIENCPMLFGPDQWPGGQNLMTTPVIWEQVFQILPYENLGINYDPSHFVWQMIDYIEPLYAFREKIFHVHFKDIKLYPSRLKQVGISAYPLEFMAPKLPGLGDVNWGRYVSALTDIDYQGYACVEVEDRAFEGSFEEVKKSLRLSKRYLEQFVI